MVRPGQPMKGRKFHASCAPRKRFPPSQLNRTARAVVSRPVIFRSKSSNRRFAMIPAKAMAKTCVSNIILWPRSRLPTKRRRIVENEERDWAERAENHGRDRETHQNCERGLPEGKAGTEKLRKHSIYRAVADASQKN